MTTTATIDGGMLRAALRTVAPAVGRGSVPVERCVRLRSALPGVVRVEAGATRLRIMTTVPAHLTTEDLSSVGDVLVPARQLSRVIAGMETVRIEFDAEHAITVHDDDLHYKIAGMDPVEWPVMAPSGGSWVELPAEAAEAIRWVSVVASDDWSRPVLTNVLVDKGRVVATDSYGLAIADLTTTTRDGLGTFTVPVGVAKRLPAGGGKLHATDLHGGRSWIEVAGVTYSWPVETTAEQFPNVAGLVPTLAEHSITFERAPLLRLLNTSLLLNDQTVLVFDGKGGVLNVRTSDLSAHHCGDVRVGGRLPGEATPDLNVAFQAGYLLRVVRMLTDEKITLSGRSEREPWLAETDNRKTIIMPVRVR